jgi:hypothetical protein
MAESELLAAYQTPQGDEIRKFRNPDGQIVYRRGSTSSSNKGGGTFVSPSVGKQIEQRAARDTEDDRQVQFTVSPRTETDRQNVIEERFPEWNNTENLDPNRIPGNDDETTRLTRGWMKNETLQQQIEKDPILKNSKEKERAKEARARQIAKDLQNVRNEREAYQVLRSYGIY